MSCVSCARTSSSTRPRVTTPEHISPESANISLTQNHMFLVVVVVVGRGGGACIIFCCILQHVCTFCHRVGPVLLIKDPRFIKSLMLRLHYVPGGHGSHFSGHRGQNGVTVMQLKGTGTTNVARRGRRDKFLNCQKFTTAATAGSTYFMCRSRTGRMRQNVTGRKHNLEHVRNSTGSKSIPRHPTICQVLLRSAMFKFSFGYVCCTTAARFVTVCHVVPRSLRRAKVQSSRFVKFSHGVSWRVTIYMPFYYGRTRRTRSRQKL